MKQIIWIVLAQLSMTLSMAQDTAVKPASAAYVPVDKGSSVRFKIKNFGFNTEGFFSGLAGKIVFDPANAGAAHFDISIDAASVNTDNNMRDNHLRKEEYFDVEKHPKITLVSTGVAGADRKGMYTLSGKLTIKGMTKDINFPFTAAEQPGGFLFKGEFTINRKDFGIGGGGTMSNSLTVMLSVYAKPE